MAARDHLEVPAPGLRDVREEPCHLDGEPGSGIALDLEVLAPAVLVPAPARPRVGARGRVHVEVAVVHVHVPAQRRADQVEHARMVDEVGEGRLAADESEQVHGAVVRGGRPAPGPVGERAQPAYVGRRQRAGDDHEAVAFEITEVGGVGPHAAGYGRSGRPRPAARAVTARVTVPHPSRRRFAVAA
jgi:hypothetical protein